MDILSICQRKFIWMMVGGLKSLSHDDAHGWISGADVFDSWASQ